MNRDPQFRPYWKQTGPGYTPPARSTSSSTSSYGVSTPAYSPAHYTSVSTPAASLSRVSPTRSPVVASVGTQFGSVASVGTQTEPWDSHYTNSDVSSPDFPKSGRESCEPDESLSSGRTTPRPSDLGVRSLNAPSPTQPSTLQGLENLHIECNSSSPILRGPPSIPPTVSSSSEKDASLSRQTVSPISLDGDVVRFQKLRGLDVAAWSMGVRD